LEKSCLSRAVLVFSPHEDDETLGCGGTIIKKKRAGADVKVCFMTDGRKSHAHLIQEEKLKQLRAREALLAVQMLGVKEKDVAFLEYKDGELINNQDSAIRKVREILQLQKPEEIFIPHHREPSSWAMDHVATNRIVMSALQKYNGKIVLYEYPIWLLYPEPLKATSLGSVKGVLISLEQVIASRLILLKDFHYSVYIGDVLELKRAALSQHRTQVTRYIPDQRWQTLGDLANGKFLDSFFKEFEIFHRYILSCKILGAEGQ
jgi:LmbE family N-acetylglucosaminyl deacetylase